MFKFLFMMFFMFILLLFLAGFSILRTFKNILFGGGNKGQKSEQRHTTNRNSSGRNTHSRTQDNNASQKKKIFTKDEGEYVDYEEVQ